MFVTRATAAGIAILGALNNVAASSGPAGDEPVMEARDALDDYVTVLEARDILHDSSDSVALDARDISDDTVETRAVLEGSNPDVAVLDKRIFPLIGAFARIGAQVGSRVGRKAASHKIKQKANDKRKQRKAVKKGRRSLDDYDMLVEARDLLEDSEIIPFDARDIGDNVPLEARAILEGSDPDVAVLDKRIFPLIGAFARIGAQVGSRVGRKAASHKIKQKANDKRKQRKAVKKGRRSINDDNSLIESRDILEDAAELDFEVRDFDDDGPLEARRLRGPDPMSKVGKPRRPFRAGRMRTGGMRPGGMRPGGMRPGGMRPGRMRAGGMRGGRSRGGGITGGFPRRPNMASGNRPRSFDEELHEE